MATMRRVVIHFILFTVHILSIAVSEPLQGGDREFPPGDNPVKYEKDAGLDAPKLHNAGLDADVGKEVPGLPKGNEGGPPKLPSLAKIGSKLKKLAPFKLSAHPSCAADVKQLCSSNSAMNNFAVLDCLQDDNKDFQKDVSEGCQHLIWGYKLNLTLDIRFDSAASEVCMDDLKRIEECDQYERGIGEVIPCMIENKENVTKVSCRQFLTKMASIVFSDYRLVKPLANACRQDIERTSCGRLASQDMLHTQGRVVECLSEHVKDLDNQCKHQILRVAELQADDYHMDRQLFYACREDREHFCARAKAGGGKVYRCLFRHKFEREMSQACRDKLVLRQNLMHENYKVNRAFSEACKQNVKEYSCLRNIPDEKHGKMSTVLLCLEGHMHDGKPVTPECVRELKEMRRSLLEDYAINPEVVAGCSSEIANSCKGMERNGVTLHCLMDLARKKHGADMGAACRNALNDLLEEADAGEDFSIDPELQRQCQPVVNAKCKDIPTGDARVIECLMGLIGTADMVNGCEEALLELQYFVARDFKLDPRLYKKCRSDARRHCSANDQWYTRDDMTPALGPMVFSCLYRKMKIGRQSGQQVLERPCQFEIRRIMRERSISVELEPRIEEPCLQDLSYYCSDKTQPGKEIECLQDNYESLDLECKWAVGNFTQDEDEDVQLDHILMASCTPMIRMFCEDLVRRNEPDGGEVMACLIEKKNHPDMNRKCAAGIEHHQLISLKDFRLSYKFKEACKEDVLALCRTRRKKNRMRLSQAEIIACLSEHNRNDTLLDQKMRVSSKCRKQLHVELFAMEEDINLDPILKEACSDDIYNFCDSVDSGNAKVLECLRSHKIDLSTKCHRTLFKKLENEAADNKIDFYLISTCKSMIKKYCGDAKPDGLIKCLFQHKDELDFDDKCRDVAEKRLISKRKDYRLNPNLRRSCKMDIPKFCRDELSSKAGAVEFEGKVINCLKRKFRAKKLSPDCETHIKEVVKEAALDYRQDPVLTAACKSEIKELCLKDDLIAGGADDGRGQVEECLKMQFVQGKIIREECQKQVVRLLAEDQVDVQVDPLLHQACALDLRKYCVNVVRGEGRQMSCLLAAVESKTMKLQPECNKMLKDRIAMWEYAAKVAPAETFLELYDQMSTSAAKNYFYSVILFILGTIFIGGLFCGRVTKRVRAELKNK